jgi:protein O-GlcNAc transferase
MIEKIISFSLWGNNPKYTVGAIRNAELAKEIYPGWVCQFYVGEDVSEDVKNRLRDLDSRIITMNDTGWNGMFWRFFAADSLNTIISRDTDSRLSLREKAAVDEWLASDKDFHIMRDHPYHRTVILGGMWGCRNGILYGITKEISEYNKGFYDNKYQVDQNFLRECIYPLIKDRAIVHDEFFENKPFPRSRLNDRDFVGQVYNEHEIPQF